LARYGGEEFVVVLAAAGLEEARAVGERLREAVAATPFMTEQGEISMTVSVGLATTDAYASADELLAAADQNLYNAKNAGRNQVVG
jgi:diguanylate cyclase (GGDEF)-like protein